MIDPLGIVAGRDYEGTEFNDAAETVERLLDLAKRDGFELTGEDIYRRFRMVFGDPPERREQ